jgi:hypothetical protein
MKFNERVIWIVQNDGDGKRTKASGNRNEVGDGKVEGEASSGKPAEQSSKPPPPDPPKQDYIHVRARRGQATDSHSLAERVIYSYSSFKFFCYIVLGAFSLSSH